MSVERLRANLADRYTIERELGQGGMATVYLAHDLKHDRQVAIKVLRPDLAASLGHDRFLREISTTAALRHPNILPLYDSGDADGILYYVMPFAEGETLRDRLTRERQLSLDEALRITGEVAGALSYAHSRGVIHRDVKPENILLESGHAVVADFGIARALNISGLQTLTQTGMAIGTPAYMSPEQAAGEQGLDGRSDLYALACVTYEMLTGKPPFTGPNAQSVVQQQIVAAPRPVTEIRSEVPGAVANAVQRALAKDPADRFTTPSAFTAAFLSNTTPRARRARPLVLAGLLIASLLLGGLAWLVFHRRDTSGLDPEVIAVMPFRTGGSNASIGYLRESMLDLMQARLDGSAGPRTVEPRTLLAAWHRAGGTDTRDLSDEASRTVARALGAGRILLGSLVATPTELTLTGSLLRTSDGEQLARKSVVGAPDSIAFLVNRLTAALLIRGAGEAPEREAGLTAAPLDALQDYLAGRTAYRRGDYFTAMRLYGQALDRDSTFVEAAYNMVATNAWIGTVVTTAGYRVIPLVWRLRDRLNPRDRALFLAIPLVGPNYPAASTYREMIAQAERAAKLAPDNPEAWTLLGQLHGFGAMASEPDWATRSAEALDRAIGLDSTFAIAVQARVFTAIRAADTAAVARFAGRESSAGFFGALDHWAAARFLGDSAAALRWRGRGAGLAHNDYISFLTVIALHSAAYALPLDDAEWAITTLTGAATSDTDRIGLALAEYAERIAAGRSDIGGLSDPLGNTPTWAAGIVEQALFEPAYRGVAAQLVARESRGEIGLSSGRGAAERWPPFADCFAALFREEGGDTSGIRSAIRRLYEYAARRQIGDSGAVHQIDLRVCPLTLEALLENRTATGTARPALDRLDSLMHDGPQWFSGGTDVSPTAFANFVVARLRAAQGDYLAALAANRRREVDYFPQFTWSLPAFLRQEGRLAALAGDTVGAARAYDQYLTLRTAPDPPFKPQRDSVRSERAALRRK
jgi:serine/threonine-protein kinase